GFGCDWSSDVCSSDLVARGDHSRRSGSRWPLGATVRHQRPVGGRGGRGGRGDAGGCLEGNERATTVEDAVTGSVGDLRVPGAPPVHANWTGTTGDAGTTGRSRCRRPDLTEPGH